MRRFIASVLLAGVAFAAAAPAALALSGTMPCCRDAGRMSCCPPSTSCQMRSCPERAPEAILSALPPAVLESVGYRIELVPRTDRPREPGARALASAPSPPDRPPRA